MDDQIPELLVRDRGLANLAREVDVLNDALERRVGLFKRGERFVESVTDVVVNLVEEEVPARFGGDEEGFGVEVRQVGPLFCLPLRTPLCQLSVQDPVPLVLELVRAPLQT